MGRRRTIIMQDEAFQTAELVRAAQITSGAGEQAGRKVEQATPGGSTVLTLAPIGDIRPILSGVPEVDDVNLELALKLTGPVGKARYGFRRQQDGWGTDVHLRQSPMVCGRRPDVIIRDTAGGLRAWKNSPRLIPITLDKSPNIDPSIYGTEGLLLLHMNQDNDRLRSFSGYGYGAPSLYLMTSKIALWNKIPLLNGELDCAPDTVTFTGSVGPMEHLVAADGVQFPDTGEIVIVVAAQDRMGLAYTANEATDARFYFYSSVFAGEAGLWTLKSRALLYGNSPDITIDGLPTSITNVVIERLPSGRLLLVWITRVDLYCSTSDDRGSTWSNSVRIDANLTTDRTQGPYALDISVMSNGLAVIVYTDNNLLANPVLLFTKMATTYDGKTFVIVDDIGYGSMKDPIAGTTTEFRVEPSGITVCERPDGFPQFYCATHYAASVTAPWGSLFDCDWLCAATAVKTELSLSDDARTDIFTQRGFSAFHCTETLRSPSLLLNDYPFFGRPAAPIFGFSEMSAVRWRGQIVLATHVIHETAKESPSDPIPNYVSNAIVVYRLNHWQPLKESLQACTFDSGAFAGHGVPYDPASGRIYNRTWEAYGDPALWGYVLVTTGGSTTFSTVADGGDGSAHGGFMTLATTSPQTRSYTDTSLPAPTTVAEGFFRAVFQVVSGSGPVGVAVSLSDGIIRHGIYVEAVRTSADSITFKCYDLISSGVLGTVVFSAIGDGDLWFEVVAAVWEHETSYKTSCFVRRYPQTTDPDWDEPYRTLALASVTTAAAGVSEYIRFGHILDGTAESRWKTVQLHRAAKYAAEQFTAAAQNPLVKVTSLFADTDEDDFNVFLESWYGARHAHLDDGVMNVMRTSLSSAVPAQFLSRGVSVAWRGEATSNGNYLAETAYQFAAEKVIDAPVMHEWRSRTDTSDFIEITFDAGTSGRPFRPNAIALFRRNFPSFAVQLNDTDDLAGWAAPRIDYIVGMPNQDLPADRHSHLWACLSGDGNGWLYFCKPYRLTVYRAGPQSATPWRPHQFRTTDTGPRYYLWVHRPTSAAPFVFRIVDNTEDTLILNTDPSGLIGIATEFGRNFNDAIAIFSDRCAVEFEHKWPDTVPYLISDTPNSHMLGYRFLRLLIYPCNHQDADENFYRLGRMIAGTSLRLDNPDYEWFFRESLLPGTDTERLPGGVTRVDARHVPIRQWTVDRNVLAPRREPDAVMGSPEDKGPKSWVEFIELAQRLQGAGEAFALVWRSERARGADGESQVQIASDYHDLAHVRVVGPGEARNNIWECQTINGPEGAETIDGPMAQVTSITFEEDL